MSFLRAIVEEAELRGIRPVEVLIERLEKRVYQNQAYLKSSGEEDKGACKARVGGPPFTTISLEHFFETLKQGSKDEVSAR